MKQEPLPGQGSMKAVVSPRYGPPEVLELREVSQPVPGPGQVLLRVRAASVHPDVWHVVTGRPYVLRLMGAGLWRPKQPVPGTDLAGEVEAVGSGVTRFTAGDAVFGESIGGYQWVNGGAYAQYACAPEANLAHKPAQASFEQAATLPTAGFIALLNLQGAGAIGSGSQVLVNGAGGGVGSIALQIAKAQGAHVTAVDHTDKAALLRSLGADRVLDYTREDFTQGQERYDLVFDVPGNHSFDVCRRVLKPNGVYVLIGHEHFGASDKKLFGLIPHFLGMMLCSLFDRQLPRNAAMPDKKAIIEALRGHLESGHLTPVVARSFPLADAAQALRYLAEGRPQGRVVIVP